MSLSDRIQSIRQTLNVTYTKPDVGKYEKMVANLRDSPAWAYLTEERGFSEETLTHFGIGYDESRNAIAIPHFKNNELINIKYRFLEPKDTRYTSEPNAEPWCFNDTGIEAGRAKGAVAITEGEFDTMALWQMGFKNTISVGSGANSFGEWIEQLDKLKSVWIAFDNDDVGQIAAKELAGRIGLEKCRNVQYPTGTKDGNEFLVKNGEDAAEELRALFAKATPFYKYEFSGLSDVIQKIMDDPQDYLSTRLLPGVRLERDQLIVLSGVTNAGKTTGALNMARDFADSGVPVLVMPFERGVYSVGRRYLQVVLNKTTEQMQFTSRDEWQKLGLELAKHPVYMATPHKDKIADTIARAKRLFGVRIVIIDHLDYLIRNVNGNRENAISDTVQSMKRLAEQLGVAVIIVTHVRKIDEPGATKSRKPNLDDLKGSSSLKQDPEVVAMLYPTEDRNGITVDILKNKGPMTHKTFRVNNDTGVFGDEYDPNTDY